MKASLKFREEQKPLLRAKVPLSILGFPFQSGIVTGEPKELSLNLSTFFESGPAVKIAYRPNEVWNPFSLTVKTGTGSFGSPISSFMHMSAEFNLLSKGSPSFMLHFKPQFGDFSIKKSHSSSVLDGSLIQPINSAACEENSSIEVVDTPAANGCGGGYKNVTVFPSTDAGDIARLLSGKEVTARTSIPVRGRAVMNFHWGVRVPAEIRHDFNPTVGFSQRRFPFLVMNKIGIQHVDGLNAMKSEPKNDQGKASDPGLRGNSAVAEAYVDFKRELNALQLENGLLKRTVEDLRQQISNGRKFSPVSMDYGSSKYMGTERSTGKLRIDGRNNEKTMAEYGGKEKAATESDVREELKKALKGAA